MSDLLERIALNLLEERLQELRLFQARLDEFEGYLDTIQIRINQAQQYQLAVPNPMEVISGQLPQ